jgi:hypothetical protein
MGMTMALFGAISPKVVSVFGNRILFRLWVTTSHAAPVDNTMMLYGITPFSATTGGGRMLYLQTPPTRTPPPQSRRPSLRPGVNSRPARRDRKLDQSLVYYFRKGYDP